MIKNQNELLAEKEVIRTETVKKANTNERVGTMFGNIIDTLFSLYNALTNALTGKVDVVSGKGLSTNDYTTEEKQTLAAIAAIIGSESGDADSVVDTVREMLTVFQNYQEGVDLAAQLNGKLSNITGLIQQGSNITIAGDGTPGNPYTINGVAAGGGGTVKSVNNNLPDANGNVTIATSTTSSTETPTFGAIAWANPLTITVPMGVKSHKWKCSIPSGSTLAAATLAVSDDADGVFISGSIYNNDTVAHTVTIPTGDLPSATTISIAAGSVLDISSKNDGVKRIWQYSIVK